MAIYRVIILVVVFIPWFSCYYYNSDSSGPQKTIYNKLTQDAEFEGFSGLIRNNKDARMDLLRKELTAFIPTNEAFQNYEDPLHSELAFYHLAEGFRTLEDLYTLRNISSVKPSFPKLWITKTRDDIYINNAKIIAFKSNYIGRTRSGTNGKPQMLHIIDEVLDPVIRNPKYPHSAYDFLALTSKWGFESVSSFFHKVKENRLSHLFQLEGAHTFFIPIDRGIDSHKFKMLNKHAVFGHMVPNVVLFSRPTLRSFNYETMSNEDDVYTVLSLEEIDNKLYVKGNTVIGNENNPVGISMAEIIEPNIPVYNGVVHLISQPLGIFNRALNPFPYLPVLEKLAADPTLDTMYEMGERTGFNKIFTTHNVTFTYFVPNDYAWRELQKKGLSFSGTEVDLLKRHLVISDTPFSMERLLAMSNSRNNSEMELKTVGGILKIVVLYISDEYFIRWHNTYIKVVRPSYECPDGLIHVLAGPIANLS